MSFKKLTWRMKNGTVMTRRSTPSCWGSSAWVCSSWARNQFSGAIDQGLSAGSNGWTPMPQKDPGIHRTGQKIRGHCFLARVCALLARAGAGLKVTEMSSSSAKVYHSRNSTATALIAGRTHYHFLYFEAAEAEDAVVKERRSWARQSVDLERANAGAQKGKADCVIELSLDGPNLAVRWDRNA